MKKIDLDYKQISELIKHKIVQIGDSETIEIFDEELVYNNKGKLSEINTVSLNYKEVENTENFIQAVVCEALNIEANKVICTSRNRDESVFRIRFSPDKEIDIVVCTITTAINNSKIICEEDNEEKLIKKNNIGIYHRLGDSCYFFRWND